MSPRPRTFQCQGALWETLERAAREQNRSVDQLIHEALARYLQPLSSPATPPPLPVAPPPASARPAALRVPPPPAPPAPAAALRSPPLPPPARPTPQRPAPIPPTQATPPHAVRPPPFPLPSVPQRAAPPPPRPAPLPRERLVVLHNGQSHDVPSSGFSIGRGKQLAGLSIRDPNISRRHAVIEEENGAYYLVDLGSTNGTHLNGTSIQRHVIREGDVARIADEELIFTFRR